MAMSLTRFSQWIWPGSRTRSRRGREPPAVSTAVANGLFPDSPSGFREPDAVGHPGGGAFRGLLILTAGSLVLLVSPMAAFLVSSVCYSFFSDQYTC